MCAPFTAMEFLKTLVRALETYKSPLSFDRVVLVEIFEIGVNNAHIQYGANPFIALYTNCDCLYLTRSGSGSQFNCSNSGSLGARYSESVIILAARLWSL